MKKIITFTIKTKYSSLPNLWHQQQVMKGSRVFTDRKKIIPRKRKYKDTELF